MQTSTAFEEGPELKLRVAKVRGWPAPPMLVAARKFAEPAADAACVVSSENLLLASAQPT